MKEPWLSSKRRRSRLAAIHVAASQLGLDDEAYRDLVERVSAEHGTACRSSGQMDEKQADRLLDELRRLGAPEPTQRRARGRSKPAHYPGTPHNMAKLSGEITKIEAQLADMRLPWAYADAIAKRMYGIERVAWLRRQEQLVGVLSALHVEQQKRDYLAAITDGCRQMGISIGDLELRLAPQLPKRWQRDVRLLKAVWGYVKERIPVDAAAVEANLP